MKKTWKQALVALFLALLVVMVLDRLTNRLEPAKVPGHVWDYIYYIDMAEKGIWGNNHLLAPYAYRFVTPLLAGFINHTLGTPTYFGFKLLAYAGLVPALWGVYLMARHFRTRFAASLIIMIIPALALFQVKFLLFDFYRPDQLAYPLMVFSVLALLKRQYVIGAALALIGLFVREFLIIPIVILMYIYFIEWWKDKRQYKPLIWLTILTVLTGMAVLLPRRFIPVIGSQQWLDPFHDPKFMYQIVKMVFNSNRDINVIFNLIAFAMPLILLSTPQRLRIAWNDLGEYRSWIIIYVGVCLFETMFGGADLERFTTFFFIPQSMLLIFIFQQGIYIFELIYMLAAMVTFNRLMYPFPIWDFHAYLNFYGGYGDTITRESWMRWLELISLIALGIALRGVWTRFPGMILTGIDR